MPGPGFIHDKLEIKFLILYLAARVIEPVPFDTMLELTLCDDAIDYFDFSDCLADLVKTEHLTLSDDGLYAITDKDGGTARSASPTCPIPSACGATGIWRTATAACGAKARCGPPPFSGPTEPGQCPCPCPTTWAM